MSIAIKHSYGEKYRFQNCAQVSLKYADNDTLRTHYQKLYE